MEDIKKTKIPRNQKRQLERDLAKQTKEVQELVKVWKLENTPNGDIPVYAFLTYGWTFPLNWAQQGKIKSGVSNDPFDDGTTRMNQACSKKTGVCEQPKVIHELKQVWEIPMELVGLDRSKANKIRNVFDVKCNEALSKYKVKDHTSYLVGEEWYREISIEGIKELRSKIWEELLIEYGTKVIEKEYKKIKARGLQIPAIKAIIKEFKNGVSRFKGIAPTGFGKTVVAFLTIALLKAQGLLKTRVVMMTAPNQFLANKNASVFNEYALCNGVKGIYNIPVFSGSDLGFNEDHITVLERKDKLASIIQGYLQDDLNAVVILHTCNPSVELVDDVLDVININTIDFAICDEAHTLASTYDSAWNYVLEDHKVKINSRFFLTATEKTLINPDFLKHVPNRGSRVAKFNYMNNKEIFGNYCFKFSFAQGVDAGHIVPMITKVFQYSNGTSSVADMLQFIDSLDIPELESIKDKLGHTVLFDKKFARTLVSIISIFKNEERNKLLTICSRNSHVELLTQVIKALQDSGKYLQDVEVKDIMACDYTPSRRQNLLDNIHDSNKKWIIITGPWAITGVDCPSIDAVHWNFTPGTEISITQGTGRGARLHEGKQNVLVTFNLDLENTLGVIRGKIASTVGKLYDAMFPSHDVELRNKMISIYGRQFASTESDDSDTIEPSLRISIDQIFEATQGVDFKQFIDSFRNRSTDEEIEILAEEFRTQYSANLIYLKEDLIKEILKSKTLKNLINIKFTEAVIHKVFDLISGEYKIYGRYGLNGLGKDKSFIYEVRNNIMPNVINTIAAKKSTNFLGIKLCDSKLITSEEIFNEYYKHVYPSSCDKSVYNIFKSMHWRKKEYTLDTLIPAIGGKSTHAKELIRPAFYNYMKNNYDLKEFTDYKLVKEIKDQLLESGSFDFIKDAFGDRTMSIEWNSFCKEALEEEVYKSIVYKRAAETVVKNDSWSCGEWDDARRQQTGKRLTEQNKNGQAKKASDAANKVYVTCPDGHVTTRASATTWCRNRGLDRSKCVPVN